MDPVRELAVELIAAAASPERRRPLLLFRPDRGRLSQARELPPGATWSTDDFLSTGVAIVSGTLAAAGARVAGILLPVRTLWGTLAVCPQPDAEALAVVAAESYDDRAGSVGIVCPVHLLPHGWHEAHAETDWLAAHLRRAVVRLPLASE